MGKNKIEIKDIFFELQKQMYSKLVSSKKILPHPVAKGDVSEIEWIEMLSNYLPSRYSVRKAFIIDYLGNISDQIDLVIFDRHFSPFIFKQNKQIYIPIESVYAVFEVKQNLTNAHIKYASKKARSVRTLFKTSAPIIDKGKEMKPRPPIHIFSGILTLSGSLTKVQTKTLISLDKNSSLDFGCSLKGKSFSIENNSEIEDIDQSNKEDSLVFFFLKLLQRLQKEGTVAPMEIEKYAMNLSHNN